MLKFIVEHYDATRVVKERKEFDQLVEAEEEYYDTHIREGESKKFIIQQRTTYMSEAKAAKNPHCSLCREG